jgi:hypothetical protein
MYCALAYTSAFNADVGEWRTFTSVSRLGASLPFETVECGVYAA